MKRFVTSNGSIVSWKIKSETSTASSIERTGAL